VVPDTVTSRAAFLWITGGQNGGSPPTSASGTVRDLARQTGTVAAEIKMVPNQPLVFAGDGRSRVEDEIIAYSFDKFMTTRDGAWPALLPMVKSAVRAMDTVQAYVPDATGGAVSVDSFVVGGASKRGWTTWLTAAVDSRVVAIVPHVIDVLNLGEQMTHHRAVYEGVTERIVGGYSNAIHDYVDLGVIQRLDTPEGRDLARIVDPYEYRERLSLPKCLINSTGDQFFVPDSAQFYFHDLPGLKYLRYIPNTDHSLSGDAAVATRVFYEAVLGGASFPEFSWTVEPGGLIRVETAVVPTQVELWQAANPEHRDFRLDTTGAAWTSAALTGEGGGSYVGRVSRPETGYKALFVELEFAGPGALPYIFTTEVAVVGGAGGQVPGDCNQDGELDISDPVCLLVRLFLQAGAGLPCGDGSPGDPGNRLLADSNGDGDVDVSDPVYLLGYLFIGGPAPPLGAECIPIEGCPRVCSE
jgi:PhoPQ-activated pathogenicity-related protein